MKCHCACAQHCVSGERLDESEFLIVDPEGYPQLYAYESDGAPEDVWRSYMMAIRGRYYQRQVLADLRAYVWPEHSEGRDFV